MKIFKRMIHVFSKSEFANGFRKGVCFVFSGILEKEKQAIISENSKLKNKLALSSDTIRELRRMLEEKSEDNYLQSANATEPISICAETVESYIEKYSEKCEVIHRTVSNSFEIHPLTNSDMVTVNAKGVEPQTILFNVFMNDLVCAPNTFSLRHINLIENFVINGIMFETQCIEASPEVIGKANTRMVSGLLMSQPIGDVINQH